MSEPDFRQMGDPLNDRLPPNRRPDRGFIQSTDDMSPEQIAIHNATQRIADIEGDPIMRRARSSVATQVRSVNEARFRAEIIDARHDYLDGA